LTIEYIDKFSRKMSCTSNSFNFFLIFGERIGIRRDEDNIVLNYIR